MMIKAISRPQIVKSDVTLFTPNGHTFSCVTHDLEWKEVHPEPMRSWESLDRKFEVQAISTNFKFSVPLESMSGGFDKGWTFGELFGVHIDNELFCVEMREVGARVAKVFMDKTWHFSIDHLRMPGDISPIRVKPQKEGPKQVDAITVASLVDFGLHVRFARRAKGWTQSELAGKVGTSRTYISLIEKGAAKRMSYQLAIDLIGVLQ